jgi:hypothetical protein
VTDNNDARWKLEIETSNDKTEDVEIPKIMYIFPRIEGDDEFGIKV